jgi:hypothetical protein
LIHVLSRIDMKRCVECGRPYRGGLNAPALLELALDEMGDAGLDGEHLRDLARIRKLIRRVERRVDDAMAAQAERLASGTVP